MNRVKNKKVIRLGNPNIFSRFAILGFFLIIAGCCGDNSNSPIIPQPPAPTTSPTQSGAALGNAIQQQMAALDNLKGGQNPGAPGTTTSSGGTPSNQGSSGITAAPLPNSGPSNLPSVGPSKGTASTTGVVNPNGVIAK